MAAGSSATIKMILPAGPLIALARRCARVATLATLLAAPVAAASPSVAFFYADDVPWDELAAFDMVVVEPDHVAALPRLAGGATELIAYVSVGEAEPTRKWAGELPPAWRIGENTAWGTAVIDQAQPEWPRFLVERVLRPLWDRGFRGFFLDALDSYQLVARDAAARRAQEDGLVRVVREIRRAFPAARLVFNRGFEILPQVHGEAYAVAAESLFHGWDQAGRRYREVPQAERDWLLGQLERVRREYRLPVIVVDYVPPENRAAARETAQAILARGFTPWVSTPELDMLGIGAIEVMPRKILMLHDREGDETGLVTDAIHRYAATPLNWLGYVPVYREARAQTLPAHRLAGRYAGIVTWYLRDEPRGAHYEKWLAQAIAEGVPVASLGTLGITAPAALESLLGLRTDGSRGAQEVRIVARDPLVGFELAPRPDRRGFMPLALGRGTPLLTVADERSRTMDAAAITPWGGYVLPPYALVELPGGHEGRWIVQPIAFLQRALRLPDMPVPDTTTESGRRLMLVHMDGDGFPSRAELPGAPLAADVMLREVLERYRVPTTVSVIQGEIAPDGLYPALSPALEAVARRMFALPHVEIASHSYSHPFVWRRVEGGGSGDEGYSLAIPNYTFDAATEIDGSLDYVNRRLAPPGKRARVFLWTGDSNPAAETVERAYAAGVLNMNGGDTLMTKTHPSIAMVAPLGIPKGRWFQVYAPNQNENVYTNGWTGPFYGYERVIETFALTDAPYRLKPIDVYFHTYSAAKRASLAALHRVYRWALGQPVMNVYASEYIAKVLDFNRIVVARTLEGDAWLVRGAGDLRTLRVGAARGAPDLARSAGVAGYARHNDQHYLHLAGGEARIALAPGAPRLPYVAEANGRIAAFERRADGFLLALDGHLPLAVSLGNAARCELLDGDRRLPPRSTAGGIARYQLDRDGRQTLTLRCRP